MDCPNGCGREVSETDLYAHDCEECPDCDGELAVTHCGCYYDRKVADAAEGET